MARSRKPHYRLAPPHAPARSNYVPWVIGAVGIALCTGLSLRATTPVANTYVPAYGARDGGYSEAILREMLVEVKLIKGEVRLMRESQSTASLPSLSFKDVVTNRCAMCHGEEKYQTDGGGFMMLTKAGELVQFNVTENRRIRREAVVKNRMPLNHPPLSAVEKAAVVKGTPLPEDKP